MRGVARRNLGGTQPIKWLRFLFLIAAHVLEACRIRRSSEKRREVLDPVHVVVLGLRREFADRHVFDHAPAQRAHCLVGQGDAPVLSEGCEPLISKQDAPLRHPLGRVASPSALPRERFRSVTAEAATFVYVCFVFSIGQNPGCHRSDGGYCAVQIAGQRVSRMFPDRPSTEITESHSPSRYNI